MKVRGRRGWSGQRVRSEWRTGFQQLDRTKAARSGLAQQVSNNRGDTAGSPPLRRLSLVAESTTTSASAAEGPAATTATAPSPATTVTATAATAATATTATAATFTTATH